MFKKTQLLTVLLSLLTVLLIVQAPGVMAEAPVPTVVTYSPVNNATGVDVNSDLILTFDQSVAGVSSQDISIKKISDDSLVETIPAADTARVTIADKIVTINPTSGLSADTAYYVLISAGAFQNATGGAYAGITDKTTWTFSTAAATVPAELAAPTGLHVTAVGDGKVELAWDANTEPNLKGYYVYYRAVKGRWTYNFTDTASYTATGLTNGIPYTFKVRAVDKDNEKSGFSKSVTATPKGESSQPAVPTNLHTTAVGNKQVSLAWDAVKGRGIKGYSVYYSREGGSWKYKFAKTASCKITGLTNEIVYTFKVQSVTKRNQVSEFSSEITAKPTGLSDPPSKPTGLQVTAVGDAKVALSWNANPESNLKGYYVYYSPHKGGWKYKFTDAASCTVEGLTNETIYTFKVRAVNIRKQMSGYSATVKAAPTAESTNPIAVPADLHVTSIGDAQVSLAWTPNSETDLRGYNVYYQPEGGTWSYKFTDAASLTVEELTNESLYTFKVQAVNRGDQTSDFSNTVTAKPTKGTSAPVVPTGLHTTAAGNGAVSLAWDANLETNLKGYEVSYMPTGGSWASQSVTANSATITGLSTGVEHTFKVRAVNNSDQCSEYSPTITATP